MAEQRKSREERIKEVKNFDFSKRFPHLEHLKKDTIRFTWQNRTVDLRTVDQLTAEAIADDKWSGMLQRKVAKTEKPAAKAKAEKAASAKTAAAKSTSSGTQKPEKVDSSSNG